MASAVETPCGRAFGAKRYHMLGIYVQRSWIVLLLCCLLSLPLYIFVTPLPKLLSQFNDESALSGTMALWFITVRFSFMFMFPLSKFLQSNLKTVVTTLDWGHAVRSGGERGRELGLHEHLRLRHGGSVRRVGSVLVAHGFGIVIVLACRGCALTWIGSSMEALSGLWVFFKLSTGVMIRHQFF